MLARMQPIAAMMEDPSMAFDFPSPGEVRPPLITLDRAAVGYTPGLPILKRLELRIDPDDRIALLGRNGNGKTTLARLLAGQLEAMEGSMTTASKIRIGYFTQYQVEELDGDSTPLELMTRTMSEKTPAAIRAQLGRFGFSGPRATANVGTLSGGERARLALALVTRDAPHLLILDEPTNHLDVDAREALVQALATFEGAVILVSHDRHMVELTADRLVLVDQGTAQSYDGSMADYIDFVLGRNQPSANGAEGKVKGGKQGKRAGGQSGDWKTLKKKVTETEGAIARVQAQIDAIDAALIDPAKAPRDLAGLAMGELSRLRAAKVTDLEAAEALWMAACEAVEATQGA
jgi:ATP-binding cassette subfamily F protein 3